MDQQKTRTTKPTERDSRAQTTYNGATKMRNDDRSTNDETDSGRLEDLSAGVEPKKPVDPEVSFADTLDAQTRAELDEVLERSTMLTRSVIAALYRR